MLVMYWPKCSRHSFLVFLDADVRLSPDALRRMLAFVKERDVALASGIPYQELGTFSEWLLLPLIHFILAGFSSDPQDEADDVAGLLSRLRSTLYRPTRSLSGLRWPRQYPEFAP